jgi:hypothetical protein
MTLHPIALNCLIYMFLENFIFFFYQSDAGNPTFIPSSVLTLSLLSTLYASHCGLLRTCNFKGQRPPRMQMRRPPSYTLTRKKLRSLGAWSLGNWQNKRARSNTVVCAIWHDWFYSKYHWRIFDQNGLADFSSHGLKAFHVLQAP